MKISATILSEKEIHLKEVIPDRYFEEIEDSSVFISSKDDISDWISIEAIPKSLSIMDFSNSEISRITESLGNNFNTIHINLKYGFGNYIFENIINNLRKISNNRILVVLYSNPLKILDLNDYLNFFDRGIFYE